MLSNLQSNNNPLSCNFLGFLLGPLHCTFKHSAINVYTATKPWSNMFSPSIYGIIEFFLITIFLQFCDCILGANIASSCISGWSSDLWWAGAPDICNNIIITELSQNYFMLVVAITFIFYFYYYYYYYIIIHE